MSAAECPACLGRWRDPACRIADLGPAVLYLHDDQFLLGWSVLVLAGTFGARKMNYALLGNLIPHVHWHVMPRLPDDPAPSDPVWSVRHPPLRLAPGELGGRVAAIRAELSA